MVNDDELAALIARSIFSSLDSNDDKCQRIEGKGGDYNVSETKLGGYVESALAEYISTILRHHRSY